MALSSNGTPISYKIESGAQCNVIPVESLVTTSPNPDLQPVNVKLSGKMAQKFQWLASAH